MLCCPHCRLAPSWYFAGHTTRKRADGVNYFTFSGCGRAAEWAFAQPLSVVADSDRAAITERWDAEAARLFAALTSGPEWTDAQRIAFRGLLWPAPIPRLVLFDRDRDEAPIDK